MHWMDGHGWMGAGWILMLLFWVFVVAVGIALAGGLRPRTGSDAGHPTPLQILRERYARGEIDRDEYEQKRADLEK